MDNTSAGTNTKDPRTDNESTLSQLSANFNYLASEWCKMLDTEKLLCDEALGLGPKIKPDKCVTA